MKQVAIHRTNEVQGEVFFLFNNCYNYVTCNTCILRFRCFTARAEDRVTVEDDKLFKKVLALRNKHIKSGVYRAFEESVFELLDEENDLYHK